MSDPRVGRGYSLWYIPSDSQACSMKQTIHSLCDQINATPSSSTCKSHVFDPHITLLPCIHWDQSNEEDLINLSRQVASFCFSKSTIRGDESKKEYCVGTGDPLIASFYKYFQCVLVNIEKCEWLARNYEFAGNLIPNDAATVMGREGVMAPYHPHLSLVYADLDCGVIEMMIERVMKEWEMDGTAEGLRYKGILIDSIALVRTEGGVDAWEIVKKFHHRDFILS